MEYELETLTVFAVEKTIDERTMWEASSPQLKMRATAATRDGAVDDLLDWWRNERGIVEERKYEDEVAVVSVDIEGEWDELQRIEDE